MTNKPVYNPENTTNKLSIQLSLNGFSFCIIDSSHEIVYHKTNYTQGQLFSEEELKELLARAFTNTPELQASFKSVEIIYSNNLYCFVPKEYYQPENKKVYFKYTIKTLATDFISDDELEVAPIVNLFIPFVNINNFLVDQFKEFNFQHSSKLLSNYLLKKSNPKIGSCIYLFFHASFVDIIYISHKKLQLYNTYIAQSNEDVLYYLLFALEQLQLSPETTTVNLLSDISDDLYNLLYTYIKEVVKSASKNEHLIHKLALNI